MTTIDLNAPFSGYFIFTNALMVHFKLMRFNAPRVGGV